ncbi:MAG: hypothetical protein MJE68_22880 [Proteobacteria bacterium]|nr:hypothetical protein [Pseudomonadota bacterium]
MFDILNDTLVPFIVAIAFLYTMLRAVTAVRREDIAKDIAKLETSINEVKTAQIETANRLEASRREDAARFERRQREDAARFEKGIADLNAKFDRAIAQINAKFDRYLFGKLEKTDDTDDSDKGK